MSKAVNMASLPVWKANHVHIPSAHGAEYDTEDGVVYTVGRSAKEASQVLRLWSIRVAPEKLRRISDAPSNAEIKERVRQGGGFAYKHKPNQYGVSTGAQGIGFSLQLDPSEVFAAQQEPRFLPLAHAIANALLPKPYEPPSFRSEPGSPLRRRGRRRR